MTRPRKGSRAEAAQVVAALASTVGLKRAAELLDADAQTALRLPAEILKRVDAAAKGQSVSRSAWIVEAIVEKLER